MPRISNAREKILAAALELFWNNSYEAVGVDAICREAGVNKGSFYHFFASKESVALTLLEQVHVAARSDLLEPAFAPDVPPRARFNRFLAMLETYATDCKHRCDSQNFPGCPIGNMILELSTQSEALRAKLEEIIGTYVEAFASALDSARRTGELPATADSLAQARLIAAAWQGGILIAKAHNNPDISVQVFRQVLDQTFGEPFTPTRLVAGT
jgi:TetR/AcrR family transcriptional repressor of nem operon